MGMRENVGVLGPPCGASEARPDRLTHKASLYLETTVASYLTSRLNHNILVAHRQSITRHWWLVYRRRFEIYVSQPVVAEAGRGDREAARRRLEVLSPFPLLEEGEQSRALAARLLSECLLPPKAAIDAAHIALAAVHSIEFLLSWNCAHIVNAQIIPGVVRVCDHVGVRAPTICTPDELMRFDIHE